MKSRVHVTEPRAKVSIRQGNLHVTVDGEQRLSEPIEAVEALYCYGPAQITGQALAALLEVEIPVHLMTTSGRYRGSLTGGVVEQVFLRMAQHDRFRDAAYRLELARGLVRVKVSAALQVLEGARRAELRPPIEELRRGLGRVEGAGDVAELLGHEGQAAAAYFGAWPHLLREGVPWGGRSRQPPRDPPNALLSFTYTLIMAEVSGQLEAAGMDPCLGFLHSFRYGRLSLACDLLEELRPGVADRWVLTLFNQRRFTPEDFEPREGGGCYLKAEALKRYLNLYGQHMGDANDTASRRHLIHQRVRALGEALLDGVPLAPPAEGSLVYAG